MVLALVNQKVVGRSIKSVITAALVANALAMAWFQQRPMLGVRRQLDRGNQYANGTARGKLLDYNR